MYEFPGGKIEPGEEPKDALKRELYEEMQAHIEVDSFFYHVHYEYPNFILEMDCFICHLLDDHLVLLEHLDGKWINPQDDNEAIVWVPADIEVINELKKRS
jgi:8-oxo-dGTP diphosphatase